MFGFSKSRENCVTFKVKIPNGYPMPIYKNAFQNCNFDKNLLQKKIHNRSRQSFDKKLKSAFESYDIYLSLKNIKPIGPLCCFKIINVKDC